MNEYTTKDFYLAAFLVASNIPMTDFSRENNITLFRFSATPKLQQLVKDFFANSALVSPIHYGNALKNLKSLIRNVNTYANNYSNITTTGSK